MNTNENHGHHDDDAPRTDEDGVRAVKVYGFRIDKKSYENPLPDLTETCSLSRARRTRIAGRFSRRSAPS
jgi:hypothetical protein